MYNKFITFFNKYYLVFLGFIIISVYFWSRFLRLRTSKVLPLDLTVLRFFVLLYICCIFIYIIFVLIISQKKNKIMEEFIDWFFTPIKELEKYFRNIAFIKTRYEKFLENIKPILEKLIIETYIFYIIFWIFPRLLLLFALFIDVFIFNQLHYKYQVILFGLLLFFNRCFKYTLKNIKEEKIQYLLPFVEGVTTEYYRGVHPSEWPENFDPDDEDYDDIPPTMCLPLEIYIKHKTELQVYNDIIVNCVKITPSTILTHEYWEKYVDKNHVSIDDIPKDYKNNFGDIAPDNYYKALIFVYDKCSEFSFMKIEEIMKLSLLIEYLNKTSNYENKFKYMKILIYINYLLCWLYVLIISMPNLHIFELLIVLIKTWLEITEPFSDTLMNIV